MKERVAHAGPQNEHPADQNRPNNSVKIVQNSSVIIWLKSNWVHRIIIIHFLDDIIVFNF